MPSPKGDYVASTVAGYIEQATVFNTVVGAAPLTFDLTVADLANFGSGLAALVSAENAYQVSAEATKGLRATRDAYLDASKSMYRTQVQVIQNAPGVSDAKKESAGITPHSDSRTPIGVPTVAPVATVERIDRLSHTLRISIPGHTGRGKPAGIDGYRVYYKIGGDAPTDLSQCQFADQTTKSTYTKTFGGADGNKTVHYIVLAVNPTGEAGPMSETLSASIAA